ncbi:hypothetical protein [Nocardioides sp.]|uniref:hypothetical protein n=1 Tax=Nocardioides sp. TaxID=35761 RepID=UPI0031FEDE9B|nr:hypothetical protein [Nocardioides sp.]
MARKVFVHVGLPKTGTTFLQTTMWHNRPLLRTQGMLYPGKQRLDHYQAFQQIRGAADRRGGVGAGAWDRLVRELKSWDGVGLVTHEFICMATPTQAARVVADLAPADVHLVITARAYALQFPAIWQEALKMGYDGHFDQFMDEALAGERQGAWGLASQDLPAILGKWSQVVPPERTHLITVPPPGGPRGALWKRWCETLDIDDSRFDLAVSYPNESLGAPQAALLRQVKPHLSGPLVDGPTRHRWVRRYFGHEVLVPQGGPRFAARAVYAAELHQRSQQAIEAIRSGGYDVVGDLADLAAESPAQDGPHPDDVSPEEMLDVATRAIEQMIRDMRAMTLERNKWRTRAQGGGGRRWTARARHVARRLREAVRP